MRWLLSFVLLLAAGCGGGYSLPSTTIRAEFASVSEMEAASRVIEAKLAELGFESSTDSDLPAEMLSGLSAASIWRFTESREYWRHRGGLFDNEDVFATLTPYPDASIGYEPYAGDADIAPNYPFLELHLSDGRPDGFSQEALAVNTELSRVLAQQEGKLIVLSSPKLGDDQEYFRYRLTGLLQAGAWWLVTWAIAMAVIGLPAAWLMRRAGAGILMRQAGLIVVGVVLVTPLPAPTMFITLLLPNALLILFPSNYGLLIEHFGVPAAIMLAASFCLSVLAALLFVRDRTRLSGSPDQLAAPYETPNE